MAGRHHQRQAWANNQAAQDQQQRHVQHQHQPQQDGWDEDFFLAIGSPRSSTIHSRNPSYAGSFNSYSPHFQDHGQQSWPAPVGQGVDLALRSHHIRPPDNTEPQDLPYGTISQFSQDLDTLSSSQARPDNAGQPFVSPNREQSSVNGFQGFEHLTDAQPDLTLHPQADPGAPSWNSFVLRTSPQIPSEEFPEPTAVNNGIDPRYLYAGHGHGGPSGTATTYADYATYRSAPPTLDGVSNCNRSDISDTHSCHLCPSSLGDPRSLRRHLKEVHRTKGAKPPYCCSCGHNTKRLWNHERHIKTCKKRRQDGHFICWCGKLHAVQKEHSAHTSECGKEKAGRRPKTADTHNSHTRGQ